MNQALVQRLRFIDFLLAHFGHFNRKHLMDYFGLSVAQVSSDISEYLILCPENCVYDKSRREYIPTTNFQRKFP